MNAFGIVVTLMIFAILYYSLKRKKQKKQNDTVNILCEHDKDGNDVCYVWQESKLERFEPEIPEVVKEFRFPRILSRFVIEFGPTPLCLE